MNSSALARRFLPLAALGVLLTPTAAQGKRTQRDLPPNAPELCPYFEEEGSLDASPFHSLGGFEFGRTDTAAIDQLLSEVDILWVETEHFELGYALGSYKVPGKERKVFEREMAQFVLDLPSAPERPKTLDPWLRALLYAWRFERLYDRMLEILQRSDDEFPDGTKLWDMKGEYMGWGPFLGQKGKYEVLMLPGESVSKKYLRETFGLLVSQTQRWNVIDRDTLIVVMNDSDSGMRLDSAMYGHLAYNLGIQLLDGYKHYSYEIPYWIRAGMGHLLEREIWPSFNTFDVSEGGQKLEFFKDDWLTPLQKLVRSGEVPRLAELMTKDDYSDMDLDDHLAAWGMTQWLVYEHPDAYAALLSKLCGLTDEQGYTDGSDMDRHHREGIRELLGWNYLQLDGAFSEWLFGERAGELNDPKRPLWR